MLFNSFQFVTFFTLTVLGYLVVPARVRHVYLLILSFIFYMGWNPRYALLLALSIVITYVCGLLLGRPRIMQKKSYRVAIIAAGFTTNLCILFFFKYFNFISDSLNSLLVSLGATPTVGHFDVLLPVGISFYTFQALGYIIDVYRKETSPERNILRYALFVSFFPQLGAGPIERSKNLLRQMRILDKRPATSLSQISSGIIIMLWGFFMKMVIADRVAVLVDTVYGSFWNHGFFGLLVATTGFSIQIYCDFAGYSSIAIGAARVLGFSLMENFNTPYFAGSIREFWRRWHISLSTWFRDYLYIPLGGNRTSKFRNKFNVMVVFLVSGLWHGANWTFLVWGGLHGAYQVLGALTQPVRQRFINFMHLRTDCFSHRLFQVCLTYTLTLLAWVFFRIDSVQDAFLFFQLMFTNLDFWSFFDGSIFKLGLSEVEITVLSFALIALFAVDALKYRTGLSLDTFLAEQNQWFRWVVVMLLTIVVLVFGMYGPAFDAAQFIYFQF
jgi:D-alanyl-lipoteichoic acid acyltransferase DltB (MBOAT superfamily)